LPIKRKPKTEASYSPENLLQLIRLEGHWKVGTKVRVRNGSGGDILGWGSLKLIFREQEKGFGEFWGKRRKAREISHKGLKTWDHREGQKRPHYWGSRSSV